MKVLFLDVDGVMNSEAAFERNRGKEWSMIDPVMARLVRRVVALTGCKIVLSSSWRGSERGEKMIEEMLGIKLHDRTAHLGRPPGASVEYRERGREVLHWLMNNDPVECYAILDDDSDFFDWQPLFKCSWKTGITGVIANAVVNHLGLT